MRRLLGFLSAITLLLAGTALWIDQADTRGCARTAQLVPRCGVLWGIASNPASLAGVHSAERAAQVRFGLVYRFHYLDDVLPTPDEQEVVRSGRVLHIAVAAGLRDSNADVTWSEVASGRYDAELRAQARGLAALDTPVFLTFEHEPDRDDRVATGGAAEFVAAWRHVHDVFAHTGATRVVWVWVVTGYPPFIDRAAAMWPGNAYVDWISWEAYNGSGCAQNRTSTSRFNSFADAVLPFYDWVIAHGPEHDIDPAKPMMISEAASVVYPAQPELTASWYRDIPKVLADHPRIKAIALFDLHGNGSCSYRFDDVPVVRRAVGAAVTATVLEPLFVRH